MAKDAILSPPCTHCRPLHSLVNVFLFKVHSQCLPDVLDAPHELLVVVCDLINQNPLPRGLAAFLAIIEVNFRLGARQQCLRCLDRTSALYFGLGRVGDAPRVLSRSLPGPQAEPN